MRPPGSQSPEVAHYGSRDPMQSSYQSFDGMQSLTMPFYRTNVESERRSSGGIHPARSHSHIGPSEQIYSSPGRYRGYGDTMSRLGQHYARLRSQLTPSPNVKPERLSIGQPYYGRLSGTGNPYHHIQARNQATPFALNSHTNHDRMNPFYNHHANMAPRQVPSMGSTAARSDNRHPSVLQAAAPHYGRRHMSQTRPTFNPSQYQHNTGYREPAVGRDHRYVSNTQNNQQPSRNYEVREHSPQSPVGGPKPSYRKVFVNMGDGLS